MNNINALLSLFFYEKIRDVIKARDYFILIKVEIRFFFLYCGDDSFTRFIHKIYVYNLGKY